MKQAGDQYSAATKVLHWGSALVIFGLLAVGLIMGEMPRGDAKTEMVMLHKSFGVLALLLILIRIPVRISNPVAPLAGTPQADVIKAKAVQGILYLLLLLMPLSGILMSQSGGYPVAFFGLELPTLMGKSEDAHEFLEELHEIGAWTLMLVLLAHIGAALLHHFKMKDDTLKRMTFRK